MKFILMMHAPYAGGDYEIDNWSPDVVEAHMDYWHRLNSELADSGELVSVQALTPPSRAKIVRGRKSDTPAITDGPFAEAKEFLAGFWIVDVPGPERAYEIAGKASLAPGPGGVALMIPIEVREVMRSPAYP
jgi:hypothetical protein